VANPILFVFHPSWHVNLVMGVSSKLGLLQDAKGSMANIVGNLGEHGPNIRNRRSSGMRPNFFIVGAPKCGTTAFYEYLRLHPEIFMSVPKEPHYFGSDLLRKRARPTLSQYLSCFEGAELKKRVGEASVFYLYSSRAAAEIKEFCPEARIIIMLRNPVEMLYSLHSELLFTMYEDIVDFEAALEAEADRKLGLRVPRGARHVNYLFYRDIGRFSSQVQRYFDAFGRANAHLVVYDHPSQVGENPGAEEKVISLKGRLLTDHVGVPWAAKRDKIDLLFCPRNVVPPLAGCKSVVTFHDLGYMVDRTYYANTDTIYMNLAMRWSVRKSTAMIAVSQNTKSDLVTRLGADPRKIHCVYESMDENYRPIKDKTQLERVTEKYQLRGLAGYFG